MLRQRRILGLLAAPTTALTLLALLPAAASADIATSGTPTISGPAQVGSTLTCNQGSVQFTDPGNDGNFAETSAYNWHYLNSTTVVHTDANDPEYTVQPGDKGKQLVCGLTGTWKPAPSVLDTRT